MPKIVEPGKVKVEGDDSYSSIAFHLCGTASRWPELLNANKNLRREPMTPAQVGMVLEIPKDWPVQEQSQLEITPAAPLVSRDSGGRATVRSLPSSGSAAPAGAVSREEFDRLGSVVRSIGEWAQSADESIGTLGDRIAILEGMRETDQQRLAEQGAEIARLRAALEASRGQGTSAPAAPEAVPEAAVTKEPVG